MSAARYHRRTDDDTAISSIYSTNRSMVVNTILLNECPHVPKLAKFKPPRCPIGVYWNTLCLMRDVWTIKTYMI